MPDLLQELAAASRGRARALASRAEDLRAAAAKAPVPLPLPLRGVIAEVKRRSPSEGNLCAAVGLDARVAAYLVGGAAALSVLTEPTVFSGSLEDLRDAAALAGRVGVPVMRKDVLVDPIQLLEARANGASGVLLVARVLEEAELGALLDEAQAQSLFVLLEAFDAEDLALIRAALAGRPAGSIAIGINTRDLATLAVDKQRLAQLAGALPADRPRVAESGIRTPADAEAAADLGFDLVLVGTALMQAADPALETQLLDAAMRSRRCRTA